MFGKVHIAWQGPYGLAISYKFPLVYLKNITFVTPITISSHNRQSKRVADDSWVGGEQITASPPQYLTYRPIMS